MIDYPDRQIDFKLDGEHQVWANVDERLPSDKSISHRMILFAALAAHPVKLRSLNRGKAVTLLLDALQQLGLQVTQEETRDCVSISGDFAADTHETVVDLGPSSAAARMLIGMLVGLNVPCIVDGDETLRNRPFDWIVEPLNQMGADLHYLGKPGSLPVRINKAQFNGGHALIRIGSAQAISTLLFAGVAARKALSISYPVVSRDHTQRIVNSFGDSLLERHHHIEYQPRQCTVPEEICIPRDPSAIAYPAALFLLCNRGRAQQQLTFDNVCLNPTRLGFFTWLGLCGFKLTVVVDSERNGEPIGRLILEGGGEPRAHDLRDKDLFHAMIDEVPLALAIACLLPGQASFTDLYELTFKESDRIAATRRTLNAFGLDYQVHGYDVRVDGAQVPHAPEAVPTFGDHRLSMTAHVLLLAHGLQGSILEGHCYKTSFPGFAECLDTLTGRRGL
ncbi:3-phosphoshikimate 1-carboxyvinyltransferase [Pseudomonas rubra]|uniref:3-phosphoshikimate 1-carboxyvinyltransferase n=1 Tax=Pseudomonas rubra TaxID=2942627 RepID=A0ABT5P377_9PSED|nr:3-phosphoshikimate 1-carboxyvinyltransferase [Pseudomonas rubra]MDD1012700.1 3-phosphoshikimate 1-carboxyvinyltransferase [Pseudomonas rubra]MDD1041592.1 3-phosphoshikimate 1-carboxyvinyltransferase [Pseudomonas rubra]MDD1155528.1 3-phosphoshikimate 1-carboxyvinyltransferase [Pseudomonas rubra]